MFGLSGFVDVAIGLIFMYLVLSLICTTVNELIATQLKWRAKSLSSALVEIIDNKEVRDAFFKFGLVANAKVASRGGDQATATSTSGQQPKDPTHPSYIDGKTFALALMDSLTADPSAKGKADPNNFPTIAEIKAIIAGLPDSNIRDVISANLATADQSIAALRDSLASWFDTAMDRLSGNYQRWLKALSLVIGIAVAFAFNADSISVGRALWGDETLRNQTVAAANQYLEHPPGATSCTQSDPQSQAKGAPAKAEPQAQPPADPKQPSADPQQQTKCLLQQLKQQQEALRPFPIGWPDSRAPEPAGDWFTYLVLKFLGCLWTGVALSLGAPFWFDLLKKFMNIRGAGPNPVEKKKT
jgi:hypothetical protein